MSRDMKRAVISYVWMAVATLAILGGYIGLLVQQHNLNNEVTNRNHALCVSFAQTRNGERDLLTFLLQPAETEGLSPERLAVITRLNEARAQQLAISLRKLPAPPVCTKG